MLKGEKEAGPKEMKQVVLITYHTPDKQNRAVSMDWARDGVTKKTHRIILQGDDKRIVSKEYDILAIIHIMNAVTGQNFRLTHQCDLYMQWTRDDYARR